MISEATLQQTDAGLVPAGPGWFVMNALNARWFVKPGQGHSLPLTGVDDQEAALVPMLGMSIRVVNPGEPPPRITGRPSKRTFSCSAARPSLSSRGRNAR